MKKVASTAIAVLMFAAIMLALTSTARGQDPPPVAGWYSVNAVVPDPPPVTRVEFDDLSRRVKNLEAKVFYYGVGQPAAKGELGPTPVTVRPTCGCSPGACPSTGFCGGEGCRCTQAKLATVPPLSAPGVAAPRPFVLSPVPATTLTTPATTAGVPSPYGHTGLGVVATPTAARVGTSGSTSGCASGACGAASSYQFAPFNGRFRLR